MTYFIRDLVPSEPQSGLTIHGAFSHYPGGPAAGGWRSIIDAGAPVFEQAVRSLVLGVGGNNVKKALLKRARLFGTASSLASPDHLAEFCLNLWAAEKGSA